MDAIERAIRSALQKGDAEDRAFRERVYRSALAALERAARTSPDGATAELDPERRQALMAAISRVETEFLPAMPAAPSPHPAAPVPPVVATAPSPAEAGLQPRSAEAAPVIAPEPARDATPPASAPEIAPPLRKPAGMALDPAAEAPRVEPDWSDPRRREPPAPELVAVRSALDDDAGGLAELPAAERREAAVARPRRSYGAALAMLALLLVLGAAAWWAYGQGYFGSRPEALVEATPEAPPPAGAEPETPAREPAPGPAAAPRQEQTNEAVVTAEPRRPGETDGLENWITVFSPSDPTTVSAPAGASAEVIESRGEQVLRIASGDAEAAVLFDVGQGILEELAGRRAIFDIVARAEEGETVQMSISCSFGELGDCGRKRYAVGPERGEFLFEIDMADAAPGAGGTIAIVPDVSAAGNPIELYEIRVTAAQ